MPLFRLILRMALAILPESGGKRDVCGEGDAAGTVILKAM
jgi:hypothetical protein